MTIIFDERKYAEKLMTHGFVRFMSQNDLNILAKYLKYIGKKPAQIKMDLEQFCLRHNPTFNPVISGYKIKKAIAMSKKYELRLPIDVPVTKKELESIRTVENYRYEKILFVMLVIAKYFGLRKEHYEGKTFFVKEKFTHILALAKIHVSKMERYKMLYDLEQTSLITTTTSNSFVINFVDVDGEVEVVVDDMGNIASFYWQLCENCGTPYKKMSGNHRMCSKCWKKRNKDLWKKNSLIYRERKREGE